MKIIGQAGIAILFASITWSCKPHSQAVSFDAHRQGQLEVFTTSLTHELPIPALGLILVKGDSLFYGASGRTSLASPDGIVQAESTPFFMGNISPLMLVTAVMRLAADGRLDLADPVVKYLPYFQMGGSDVSGVTIRHLMNQTAGVPVHASIWDRPDFSDGALERTTQSIRFQPAEFTPPGSRVKRSAYNYDILADLIAKVSGMHFEDYMQRAVLQPLGLKYSFYPKNESFEDKVAQPHRIINTLNYAIDSVGLYPANREHAGSMGLHATSADLARWLYMLVHKGRDPEGKQFLPQSWAEQSFASFPIDAHTAVGYGWEISSAPEGEVYEQYHDMGGFSAHVAVVPNQELAVALISNISGDFDMRALSGKLMDWLRLGGDLPPAKPLLAKALGDQLLAERNIDSVFRKYDRLRAEQPQAYDYSLSSLSQLGVNLLYKEKEIDWAIGFFEACVTRFPQAAEAHLNLAEAYFVARDSLKSKGTLEQAKALLAKERNPNVDLSARIALLEGVAIP